MRYLYLLLLISLGALLWAAFSIARHIRKHPEQDTALPGELAADDEVMKSTGLETLSHPEGSTEHRNADVKQEKGIEP